MKKSESFLTSFVILMTLTLCIKKALTSFIDVQPIHLFVISIMVLFHLIPIKICSEFIFKETLKKDKRIPQMFLCSIYILTLLIALSLFDSKIILDQNFTDYQKSVLRYFNLYIMEASYCIILVNGYFTIWNSEWFSEPAKK